MKENGKNLMNAEQKKLIKAFENAEVEASTCISHNEVTDTKRVFKIKTKFVFNGEFHVKAETKQEAREMIDKHCGLVLGGDIHSSLPDEDVNWEFFSNPQKIIK